MLARLAAELERDRREALGGGDADGAAGLDPAGEGDLAPRGMVDQRLAGGPGPVTTLSTPAGKPTSVASRATSSIDAGVTSDGLTTTVLPAASAGAAAIIVRNTRRVPRRDDADHAERLAKRVVEDAQPVERDRRALDLVGHAAEVADPLRDQLELGEHLAVELAVVARLERARSAPRASWIASARRKSRSPRSLAGNLAPGAVERLARAAHAGVDVVGGAAATRAHGSPSWGRRCRSGRRDAAGALAAYEEVECSSAPASATANACEKIKSVRHLRSRSRARCARLSTPRAY